MTALLLAAFALRVYGLTWDQGSYLHPDEMYITQWILIDRIHLTWPPDLTALLHPATSGLNPRSADPATGVLRSDYAYGALPLYVTDVVAEGLDWVSATDWHGADHVYLVGRAISALLDTLTVLLVYLIGHRVASPRVGLFASAVAAMAPMSIQLAHFFTTDSWLTCFVALTLLWSIAAAEDDRLRRFALAGAGVGLAMATKGSVFVLASIVALAVAFHAWHRQRAGVPLRAVARGALYQGTTAAAAALVAFALFEPYALARPDVYLQALARQAAIVRGTPRHDIRHAGQQHCWPLSAHPLTGTPTGAKKPQS